VRLLFCSRFAVRSAGFDVAAGIALTLPTGQRLQKKRHAFFFRAFPFPICETRRCPLLIEACSH
jgi:hypothetical protein